MGPHVCSCSGCIPSLAMNLERLVFSPILLSLVLEPIYIYIYVYIYIYIYRLRVLFNLHIYGLMNG